MASTTMASRYSSVAAILAGTTILVVGTVGTISVVSWLRGEKWYKADSEDQHHDTWRETDVKAQQFSLDNHSDCSPQQSTAESTQTSSLLAPPSLHMSPSDLQKAIQESRDKLDETAATLRRYCTDDDVLHTEPATTLLQLRGYRCRFTLQIILPQKDATTLVQYGVRHNGQVLPLETASYEFANPGLRQAMSSLLQELNSSNSSYNKVLSHGNVTLATVTFTSSWDGQQRWATFHYQQLQQQASTSTAELSDMSQAQWMAQAQQLQERCGFQVVRGRSRGQLWQVLVDKDTRTESNSASSENDLGLLDTLLLFSPSKSNERWVVASHNALLDPSLSAPTRTKSSDALSFQLFKPEGAFCHPNAQVMCRALGWILTRIQLIHNRLHHDNDDVKNPLTLLELYCGCGAHTIPIGRSGLVSKILAVEYDERLVQACRNNLQANHLEDCTQVIAHDANQWAKRRLKKRTQNQQDGTMSFQLLLVDPPRQGLHPQALELALHDHGLCDIIYISCGKDALVRDLNLLADDFKLADCTVTDLFPGTSSVESLVHLTRRH